MENENITKSFKFQDKEFNCAIDLAIYLIGGKWKAIMLYHLKDGAMRSGDLQRSFTGIANKMFTQTARELEGLGLIERVVYPVVPPKVEYQLTPMGESVMPIIQQMGEWAAQVSEQYNDNIK
ncbi:MAG: winged helix-turn-helix transcriptional regulator [Marinifilaceae bacterium]